MWNTISLTTADNIKRLSFRGKGSIFVDGTFGGGAVQIHPVAVASSGIATAATGFIDTALDATTKSAEVPSGHYELNLAGSTSATVLVYYNEQEINTF